MLHGGSESRGREMVGNVGKSRMLADDDKGWCSSSRVAEYAQHRDSRPICTCYYIDYCPTNGIKEGTSGTTVTRSKGKDPLWNPRTFPYCAALFGARKSYLCVMIGSTHMWPLLAESNRIRRGRSIDFIPSLFFSKLSPVSDLTPPVVPWTPIEPLDPY